MNILEKKLSDYTPLEFFKFLLIKEHEIKNNNILCASALKLYQNCCNIIISNDDIVKLEVICNHQDIKNMISNDNNKDIFKKILMNVFGSHFFELSKEEIKINEENGFFTKDNIDLLFEGCISNHYGISIINVNSWDDFINNISNIFLIVTNNNIPIDDKQKYYYCLAKIENVIKNRCKNLYKYYNEQVYVISIIEDILKCVNKNKEINIDNIDEFRRILNDNIFIETVNDDKTITYEDIKFGDITIECINEYNELLLKDKASKMVDKKVSKYYKQIKKTSVDKLENDMFPDYSMDDVVVMYKLLIERFNKAIINGNSKLIDDLIIKLNLVQIMYAGYFKSKYYDEDKVFKNIK